MSSSTERPVLSVITVSFRDLDGLRRTLASLKLLAERADGAMEVLVQDGGTGGAFAAVRSEFDFPWARFVSEPDNGIYDGMNRGLARSRGDFVWFLNGGDRNLVDDWGTLHQLLRENTGKMIFCSYELDLGSRSIARRSRTAGYLRHALPTSHQAIFYPGSVARHTAYDLSYEVSADYAFTAAIWVDAAMTTQADLSVAVFAAGGTSQQQSKSIALEASRVQRDILGASLPSRGRSRIRHMASRNLRNAQTTLFRRNIAKP
jgi:putative colanic acid biosynthesis glycosyltransferase